MNLDHQYQEHIIEQELLVEQSELLLYNDDVNTFDHVINMLCKYCEHDLIQALNNNIISCAALDVYDQEPLPRDHILRKTKNLILTPHIGYVSEEAYKKFFNGYLKAVEAFINKKQINQIS